MTTNKKSTAEAYYLAISKKDFASVQKMLHPEVTLSSPLAKLLGKEAVFESVKNFASVINGIDLRACFGSDDQAMVAYDAAFAPPIGNFPGASLLTFKDDLIVSIDLFYDGRAVEKKRDEIFS